MTFGSMMYHMASLPLCRMALSPLCHVVRRMQNLAPADMDEFGGLVQR
jgi:hypothetical protein